MATEEVSKPNPDKVLMTVWRCPDCNYLNELDS
jgi:rubrerythrin